MSTKSSWVTGNGMGLFIKSHYQQPDRVFIAKTSVMRTPSIRSLVLTGIKLNRKNRKHVFNNFNLNQLVLEQNPGDQLAHHPRIILLSLCLY